MLPHVNGASLVRCGLGKLPVASDRNWPRAAREKTLLSGCCASH